MFWRKKHPSQASDLSDLLLKANSMIEKEKSDEYLYLLYCALLDISRLHGIDFKKNHQDWPTNFGVKNLKIDKQ